MKGWFKDTLTPETCREHSLTKASLIMVDCDIYAASRECLRFCEPLIRDRAVVFFDDWGNDPNGQGKSRPSRSSSRTSRTSRPSL